MEIERLDIVPEKMAGDEELWMQGRCESFPCGGLKWFEPGCIQMMCFYLKDLKVGGGNGFFINRYERVEKSEIRKMNVLIEAQLLRLQEMMRGQECIPTFGQL